VANAEPARRGAQLGAEEAGRTAELLGASFELRVGTDAQVLVDRNGVLVLVGGLDDGLEETVERLEIPLLTILPAEERGPLRRHVFHVASSPAERRAALARWGRVPPEGARVVDWHPSLTRFGAEQLNQRFEARFGTPMDSLAWASWMAVKISAEVALRNPSAGRADLSARLERLRFDGHKGARLSFRSGDHGLRQPLYVVAGDQVLGEVAPPEEEE
jgi:hypothetical protein